MTVQLLHGDCIEMMRTLPDASVDSIVTDPPYHLTEASRGGHACTNNPAMPHGRHRIGDKGFMGKVWDGGDVAFRPETWAEALRVLKPGGHLLAFSGTRTYHRMVCAIEDAGFEIRDQIGWVYGSGFPKSRNLDGEWEGWGTALKPAWEPIVVARKPLSGTVAANVLEFGTGALNIDGCRVGWPDGIPPQVGTPAWGGPAKKLTAAPGQQGSTVERAEPSQLGRWPANLIHDGSDEVLAAFPQAPGQLADASGNAEARKTQNVYGAMRRGRGDEPSADSDNAGAVGFRMKPGARRLDAGSAARFFYCAKASKADRGDGNTHPTVKPTDLMRYLCRLVTPPGGLVLDPFMGSGSTGRGAVLEGFAFIGIEREAEYLDIARARIAAATQAAEQATYAPVNLSLFAEVTA